MAQAFVGNLARELPHLPPAQLSAIAAVVREAEARRLALEEWWASQPPTEWDVEQYTDENRKLDAELDNQVEKLLPEEWHATYRDWRILGGPYLQYEERTQR